MSNARKITRPTTARKPPAAPLGHLDDLLREGGAKHTMADARVAIVAAQRLALEVCAAALLALDDPFAPESFEAVDRFDLMFDPDGAGTELHVPAAVVFALEEARVKLSWGGQKPQACPGRDHPCGYAVQRGERFCWLCQAAAKRAKRDAA